ncbi:MAG: hypothetical protein HKM04_05225 [Legionellales bacterium]|nr:hypothetical protein [Legionellales bacterium]
MAILKAEGNMDTESNKTSLRQKVKEKYNGLVNFIHYQMENRKNQYQCQLIGEKINASDKVNTVLIFRMMGKRDIHEIPVDKLLEDKTLVEKFCPTDGVKIGIIAMGDMLLNEENQTKAIQKIEKIKKQMFK